MIWRRGVSPKALVTTNQLALSLLGDMVASLWKPKPLEHAFDTTLHLNPPIKHQMLLINHFKGRGDLAPKLRRSHTHFHLWNDFKPNLIKNTIYG